MNTKLYANVPCSTKKGLAKETFAERRKSVASQWLANGSPEGLVSGQQGISAIDKTREADNKYELNTIDGNTGWTLISEMGRQVLFEDDFQDITNTPPPPPTNYFIDDSAHHKPNINVVGNNWVTPPSPPFSYNRWKIYTITLPYKAIADIATPNALAYVDVKNNVVLKALFKTDLLNGSYFGGVVFRLDAANPNSCWTYRLKKDGSNRILELFEPGSPTSLIPLTFIPSLGTGFFELKVIMKDSFISIFYNDLLVLSLNSIHNISFTNHGIIANTDVVSKMSCHCFKVLNN